MPPRLRDDLVAATVEEEGVCYVDVSDPVTGVNFRFYDFEYELAKQFDGQDVAAVATWGSATYGLELTNETLDQFVEKLAGLGFLAGAGAGAQPAVLSPISPSSGAPFGKGPVALPFNAEPDVVELASAPMFGAGDAGVATTGPRAGTAGIAPAASSTTAARLVSPAPPPRATAAPTAPIPSESSAPRALTEGDPTEYRLGDAKVEPKADASPETKASPPTEAKPAPSIAPKASPPTEAKPAPSIAPKAGPPASAKPEATAAAATKPDTKGGYWGKGRTLHGISLAPLLPQAEAARTDAPDAPAALPRLQALGSPLPPLSSQPTLHGVSLPTPVEPKRPGSATDEETPLATIAHAIVAESASPWPTNALEPATSGPAQNLAAFTAGIASATVVGSPAGFTSPPGIAAPLVPPVAGRSVAAVASAIGTPGTSASASPSPGNESAAAAAWANALADAVEKPLVERRQPPAPEIVVMPPVVEKAAMPPIPKRHAPLIVGVLLVGGLAAAAVYATRNEAPPEQPSATAVPVHVIAPQPTTYYRWFSPTGSVVPGKDDELSFKIGGKLQDVMPPGTTFSAGEAVARLQGVAARELNVNRARARLAFVEQLRDSSRAAGNQGAARAAEVGIAARKKDLADAQSKLGELEIRPVTAGVIGQVLLERGALVKADAPVFRIRATGPRATFALSAQDRAAIRTLGFCRLETIPGGVVPDAGAADKTAHTVDCTLAPAPADSHEPVAVDLQGGLAPGTQVRLASARFDGVFPIPRTAVSPDSVGGRALDRVWLASGATPAAESRVVELAGTVDQLALVSRGLTAGDSVIVDPPAGLTGGAALNVRR